MKHFFSSYLFFFGLLLISYSGQAQMAGGSFSGQSAPKEVKAADVSKGAYTSDVNLFTGTMATSYDLGTVSTPSGLHFNLQLSHSSAKTVGNNPLVVAGIPYGDGWNINAPTISISSSAYQKYSNSDIAYSLDPIRFNTSSQTFANYSKKDMDKEGSLAWYAPVINIPGVINDRFIFKAYDRANDEAIFVPNNMENYVEARMKYGSYWKVTDHNGDVYSFTSYSSSYHNAPQLNFTEDSMHLPPSHVQHIDSLSYTIGDSNGYIISNLSGITHPNIKIVNRDTSGTGKLVITYWVITGSFAMQDNLLPKQEINTWYCDYIYNKNAPLNQQISFHYSSYGSFDFFKEINQEFLNRQISSDYNINSQGTIPAFKFSRDVLLESVSSYYKDRGMIEEIDLVHQTVNPAYSAGVRNMLLITEPSVQRLDSMYNYRIVYSQGVNTLQDSSLLQSNAYRASVKALSFNAGANVVNSSFSGWRRYLHVMSDNTIASGVRPSTSSSNMHHPAFASNSNPYLFPQSGYSTPIYKFDNATVDPTTSDIKFSHSFLESPRIPEDIIPGDIYEVRSVIRNYNTGTSGRQVKACNFDVNIVSGYNVPLGNVTYSYGEIGDAANHVLQELDYQRGIRGVNIFNTFGNPLKWTSYANTNGVNNTGYPTTDMVGVTNTSNFFLMPVIPKKFQGVNIQVGPANSDIDVSLDMANTIAYMNRFYGGAGSYRRSAYFAYKKVQEDDPNGQYYPDAALPNPHFKPGANFGIGMPWYMMNETYARLSGSPNSDQLNSNYLFWWKDNNNSLQTGIYNYLNKPTAADDSVSLSAMELVRYSKNPYMLVAVKKYKFNGYAVDDAVLKNKYLVSQLNLKYDVKVDSLFTNLYQLKNIPIAHDTTIGCQTYYYSAQHVVNNVKVFVGREFVGFQNVYLLAHITQIPVNGSLGNAASSFIEADMPTTHFTYKKLYADSLSKYKGNYDLTGNLYAMTKITDQLGGTMVYDYFPLHDAKHTRWVDLYRDYFYSGTPPANLYNLPGPDVYKIQIAVKTKRYYSNTGTALPNKTWVYDYSDNQAIGACENGAARYFHGVSPPSASFPNYRFTDVQLDYGFKKTTISYPQLATNGLVPYDVYTHYTTENSYMTFGKLQKKEQYDAANTLLHKTEYIYKKSMAFGNFMLTNNVDVRVSNVNNWDGDEYFYRAFYGTTFSSSATRYMIDHLNYEMGMNTDYQRMPFLELTNFTPFKSINNGHYANCYFVRLVKEINTDYDYTMPALQTLPAVTAPALRGVKLSDQTITMAPAPSGTKILNSFSAGTAVLFSGLGSIKHAISMLTMIKWPGLNYYWQQPIELTTVTDYEYWDADSTGATNSDGFRRLLNITDSTTNKIRLTFEPSWELFRTSTSSPQLPQAYKKTELYYYYDAKQDVNINNPDFQHPENLDALYYSHKYGIRNLVYQKRDIGKAVSHPEVSKSIYYWYDTKTKTDTVFMYDTLMVATSGSCPGVSPSNPTHNPEPAYESDAGCIEVPHPYSPPPPGWHFSQTGPNSWMYCPNPPGAANRPLFLPNDLRTKLLLRRVDEQVDTMRIDIGNTNKYYPVLRFSEFSIADPLNANAVTGYDYDWKPNYICKTVYRTLAHTPLGFVREDMNERFLHTRYDYHPTYSTTFLDAVSHCNRGGAFDMTNQGVPECITVGYGLPNALTTCYKYNPDFTVDSITDPNGMVLSYRYDPFSRMRMALRNGDTLSLNAYSQWMNDTSLTFEQRANQNYVESYILLNKGSGVAEHSRAYVDPLGRKYDVQTQVSANYTNPSLYDTLMVHSGLTTFDNWDRVEKQYKPFKYTNGGSPVLFAPRFNPSGALYTEQAYESNQRGRPLRAAKFGQSISTGHTVNSSYQIITGTQLFQELGQYNFVFINELSGTTTNAALSAQHYLKTAVMDEDGNKTVSYANAFGQKVASKNYPNSYTALVTAFIYDSQGNLKKVVDAKDHSSTYEYNLSGNLFRKVTPDTDTTKYMYDVSGNVVLEQDANGKHGVDETDHKPYMRRYTYDAFNRLVLQDRIHYNRRYDPLYYSPTPLPQVTPTTTPDSSTIYYNFSHGASLDFVTGWFYYKCYYVYRPTPANPSGPWNPNFPPVQPPVSGGGRPCVFLYINPYDSLNLAAHEKAWVYSQQAVNGADPDFFPYFLQNHFYGRLSLVKSYTHAGSINNLAAYGYNANGQLEYEVVQFNKPAGGYLKSTIHYTGYNLRNSLTSKTIDIDGDGTPEKNYSYTYDGWNRLRNVGVGNNSSTMPIVGYDYDDALGLLKKTSYYDPHNSCMPVVDAISYSYDARNRLTALKSTMYSEQLYYDLFAPLTAQPAFAVNTSANFNGNINGIRHHYKTQLAGNYSSTAGIMDSSTVYGYAYDGINRLTFADASVLNVLDYSAGPAVYNSRMPHGDESLMYDEMGNITNLNRGLYQHSSTALTTNATQNWQYTYQGYNNKLASIDSANSIYLRTYAYDMNGNSTYQQAGKSKLNADYMRSNLPKHIIGTKDTIVNTLTDLYYDYNTHDDRIYKEIKQGSTVLGSTYYLRDGAGTELAEWDLVSNNKTYYTYGRERVAEEIGNSTKYYINDHLGSVHLLYNVVSNCLGQPTIYRLQSATDYYAFGKVLRSYNGTKYGYQSSEKNPELGNNDYYTHFRGLDVDIARWKGVDPVFNSGESPYTSMNNNPVILTDPKGDCPTCPVAIWELGVTAYEMYTGAQNVNSALTLATANISIDNKLDLYAFDIAGKDLDHHMVQIAKAEHPMLYNAYLLNRYKGIPIISAMEQLEKAERLLKAEKTDANPTKNRVKLRKDVKQQIQENQPKNDEGEPVDPNDKKPLKDDPVDIGHKPGNEWWKRKQMHLEKNSSRKEVIEEENNANLYHLERRSNNRSHKYEEPK